MATFDFFRNVRCTGVVCTRSLFEDAVQAPALRALLGRIAAETDGERRAALKRQLPVVTWQAHFTHGRRRNADAVPSGLFMVDIDHVANARKIYKEKVKPHLEDLRILVVHLTPSTHGLRIVAVCDPALPDIAANQRRVADTLGVEIDTVCKDLARSSFLVSKDYFYYLNPALWKEHSGERGSGEQKPVDSEQGKEREPQAKAPSVQRPPSADSASPLLPEGAAEASYLGIPYADIVRRWWEIHYGGQEPVKSNRNTLTFELACALRHICGFSRELLDRVIPCYDGFPEEEKRACIDSALKEKITRMPPRLHQVLLSIKAEHADNTRLVQALDEAEERDEQHYINRIPPSALPMGVRDSLEGLPRTMALPALIGIGPMIGALATGVRLDVHGDVRHLNLTAYIVGEAASGKSQLDALYQLWMAKLIRQDDEALRKEQEFIRLREQRKNAKEQPQDPKVLVRCQSLRTSIAQLLTRLQQSQGKHLFSYTSEADQLSQNSSSAWANTSVLQRDAYDNSAYSTDFANGKSTGVVIHKVLWNMTLCCTPDALYRAHRNYTNGAITRLAIARTPDNTYSPLPEAQARTPEAEERIRRVAERLEGMEGVVCLPRLEQRSRQWLERVRLETLKNDDKVRARLRMRAAVTAMRYTTCFLLCRLAEQQLDEADRTAEEADRTAEDSLQEALAPLLTDDWLTLFDTLADYILDTLLFFFRSRIEAAYASADYQTGERERQGANDTFYSRLPEAFTLADAVALRGGNSTYHAASQMVRNWVVQGLAIRTGRGAYRKVESAVLPK